MFLLLWLACGEKDTGEMETVQEMTFTEIETEVLGLSCAFSSCHGGGASGLFLNGEDDYNSLVDVQAVTQPEYVLVKPGSPDESLLYLKMTNDPAISGDSMPPGMLLDDHFLEGIRLWILSGANP